MRGLAHAAFVMLTLGMVLLSFAVHTQAWNLLCGAWAEDNTREGVAKAIKAGHVWCQVSSIEMGGSDIDHVVIAPGGVLMVESKWSFVPMDKRRSEDVAARAVVATGRLRSILRSVTVKRDITVTAVVEKFADGQIRKPVVLAS